MPSDEHGARVTQSDRGDARMYDCPNCGTISKHRTVLVESAKMENVGVRRCIDCHSRVVLQ